jgi:hypothetical protein
VPFARGRVLAAAHDASRPSHFGRSALLRLFCPRSELPEYYDVVTRPMDLGTVHSRLAAGAYADASAFEVDVRLVWDNCKQFNTEDSEIYLYAQEMAAAFEKLVAGGALQQAQGAEGGGGGK